MSAFQIEYMLKYLTTPFRHAAQALCLRTSDRPAAATDICLETPEDWRDHLRAGIGPTCLQGDLIAPQENGALRDAQLPRLLGVPVDAATR